MKSKSTNNKKSYETAEAYRDRLNLGKPYWNATGKQDELLISYVKPVTGHESKGLDD